MAGPLQCAVYEKTPQAIKARVDAIWRKLKVQPIPTVIGTGPQDYGLVDYGLARNTIFDLLYSPFALGGQKMSPPSRKAMVRRSSISASPPRSSSNAAATRTSLNLAAALAYWHSWLSNARIQSLSTTPSLDSKHITRTIVKCQPSRMYGRFGCSARMSLLRSLSRIKLTCLIVAGRFVQRRGLMVSSFSLFPPLVLNVSQVQRSAQRPVSRSCSSATLWTQSHPSSTGRRCRSGFPDPAS
jgi:hypothetical protein